MRSHILTASVLAALGACVQPQQPTPPTQPATAPTAAVPEAASASDQLIAELKRGNDELRTENQTLRKQVDDLREKLAKKEATAMRAPAPKKPVRDDAPGAKAAEERKEIEALREQTTGGSGSK